MTLERNTQDRQQARLEKRAAALRENLKRRKTGKKEQSGHDGAAAAGKRTD